MTKMNFANLNKAVDEYSEVVNKFLKPNRKNKAITKINASAHPIQIPLCPPKSIAIVCTKGRWIIVPNKGTAQRNLFEREMLTVNSGESVIIKSQELGSECYYFEI